jgi:hypothetical protein
MLRIPYLDTVEQFIGCMKSKHPAEHTAEEIFTEHQIAASPHYTKTSPPTKEPLQPKPKEEERPPDSSAATTTVLHICGYLLLSLLISQM